jgi:hypothetical protein
MWTVPRVIVLSFEQGLAALWRKSVVLRILAGDIAVDVTGEQ